MNHLILLFGAITLIAPNCHSQHIVLYKTENIICNGDTFWKRTYVNKKEQDTTYTYTPDIPGPCITEIDGKTYLYVERMPHPTYDLDSYLLAKAKYPDELKRKQVKGIVAVQFLVDRDGSIKEVNVVRTLHPIADSLAANIVASMPKWVAGRQGGKPVPVHYACKVPFKPTD